MIQKMINPQQHTLRTLVAAAARRSARQTDLSRPFGADGHFRTTVNPGLRFACPGLVDVPALRA